MVPALHKEGYIVPITLLIKVIPSLVDGIRIVTFIGRFEEDLPAPKTVKSINYILYRTDTEQIMGVTEGLFLDFGIEPCLIYGNPLNKDQKLCLPRVFGGKI